MINENLQKLGFSDKEIEIYLSVLKFGKVTPSEVARATNISRPTVYSVAKSLVKKGVISEDLGGKTLFLVARPLEEIKILVSRDKEKLMLKEELINATIVELSPLVAKTLYSIPKIRFIEAEAISNYLYKQATSWNDSAKKIDGVWWGFQDHTFVENYNDWIDYIWEHVHPDGRVKLLSNKSDVEKELKGRYQGREIKYWNKPTNFTATTWVVGEYLVMIRTNQEPFYLVEIYDPVLAHNMREVFKNIWNEI
jgi:sugar-specific transcriptional regulator TrmB